MKLMSGDRTHLFTVEMSPDIVGPPPKSDIRGSSRKLWLEM